MPNITALVNRTANWNRTSGYFLCSALTPSSQGIAASNACKDASCFWEPDFSHRKHLGVFYLLIPSLCH